MRIESVPLIVKNIETEVTQLRKIELTKYYIDNMNFQNSEFDEINEMVKVENKIDVLEKISAIQNVPTISVEKVAENIPQNSLGSRRVLDTKFEDAVQALMDKDTNIYSSSFISSTTSSSSSSSSFIPANLIADIEASLFSSYIDQTLKKISSSTSSTLSNEKNQRKLDEYNIINAEMNAVKSKIKVEEEKKVLQKEKEKEVVTIIESGTGPGTNSGIQSDIFVPLLSEEMRELMLKKKELNLEWQSVRGKLTAINKGRIFIEGLKTSLKSAIKLGNHSRIDAIERFEMPNKEKEMITIFESISPLSPFYYLCDSVTTTEIANIMAKNTGIPMGNLLEGKWISLGPTRDFQWGYDLSKPLGSPEALSK